MPYPKLIEQDYKNLGGINQKVSPQNVEFTEFLDLTNYDFLSPGALRSRDGSSFYVQTASGLTINGMHEFVKQSGASYITFADSGTAYFVVSNSAVAFQSGLSGPLLTDFLTYGDQVWFCNGNNFKKFDGTTVAIGISQASMPVIYQSYTYGLPNPDFSIRVDTSGYTLSGTFTPNFWGTTIVSYKFGFVNSRGFHGPATTQALTATIGGNSNSIINFFLFDAIAKSNIINIPASYGIGFSTYNARTGESIPVLGYIAVYRADAPSNDYFRVKYIGTEGNTFWYGLSQLYNNGAQGLTVNFQDKNFPQSNFPAPSSFFFSLTPQYIETFNNQMFMAGFSGYPNVCWFSEVGDPETIDPTFNFEVQTNDGDVITCMKTYLNQLVIFKLNSFHVLRGDDVSNFTVSEITRDYGALNKDCSTTYKDYLVFLDTKGLVRWNGGNIEVLSNKVEPIFRRMNLAVCKKNSFVVHNKVKNQVWVGLALDTSTVINTILVWDYLLDAWTKFEGNEISAALEAKAFLNNTSIFFGSNTGMIKYFGSSLTADFNRGITYSFQTRFTSNEQESVQKNFRQLFTNFSPAPNSGITFKIDFYKDYSSATLIDTRYINQTVFQTRIDFGYSAKSLSFRMTTFSSQDYINLHGYTVAHRFLRDV